MMQSNNPKELQHQYGNFISISIRTTVYNFIIIYIAIVNSSYIVFYKIHII
jgi:hypothetical protein